MTLVENTAAVYEAMQAAKRPGQSFVTNFFPSRPKLESWIGRRELSLETSAGGAFFLRRDADFSHLYFFAADLDDLRASLGAVLAPVTGTVVADLLGRDGELGPMEQGLAVNGFSRYARLVRLSRTAGSPAPSAIEPGVEYAEPADAPAITAMLHSAFDRYAEQLPVESEVRDAAANRGILVARSADAIAGLLFFEADGLMSILRYWLVDAGFRNQRIGARLIRSYFAACRSVKRFTLWVLSDNDNAAERYRHYGYATDGLVDQVMIRRQPSGAGPQVADRGGLPGQN